MVSTSTIIWCAVILLVGTMVFIPVWVIWNIFIKPFILKCRDKIFDFFIVLSCRRGRR